MKNILITGANGFIGASLAKSLSKEFNLILNSFRSPNSETSSLLKLNKNIKFIKADISNIESVYDCVLRADYVFHLASIVGKNTCEENVHNTFNTNVLGTLNIFKACKDAKKKITYLSLPNLEDYSLYALSKSCADRFAQMYMNIHNLDISIIRLFNCYGPTQNDKSGKLIINIIKKAIEDKPLEVFGDGSQKLNFIYLDDVVRALADLPKSHKKGIYYLGSNTELTVNQVIERILKITNSKSKIVYSKERIGDLTNEITFQKNDQRINLDNYTPFDDSIKKIIEIIDTQK